MHYFKYTSDNGEMRWINFDQVSRVTHAMEDDEAPILAVSFVGQHKEEALKIHGDSDHHKQVILNICAYLDDLLL